MDADWLLPVLRRHGLITDEPGWRVALAPGGSTDRTFRVSGPDSGHQLTLRLARPGLRRWLRHEAEVLRVYERTGEGFVVTEHGYVQFVPLV